MCTFTIWNGTIYYPRAHQSDTSTGKFAGATGVLYFNGKTVGNAIPITYPSDIIGEICFAHE
jgi:hypothetical protein